MSEEGVQIADQCPKTEWQDIPGLHKLSRADLEQALAAGRRFVFYEYCISLVVVTLRRPSALHVLPVGSRGVLRGVPYVLVSLLLGWWALPWGIVYTPLSLITNLTGGCDVTAQVRALLAKPQAVAEPAPSGTL
ncbi:MAG TPA: hypothetical protein VGY66_32675 [Gemmataceae bacterium]|nr:hypothetical protein [Gemmataceae bacterium]